MGSRNAEETREIWRIPPTGPGAETGWKKVPKLFRVSPTEFEFLASQVDPLIQIRAIEKQYLSRKVASWSYTSLPGKCAQPSKQHYLECFAT